MIFHQHSTRKLYLGIILLLLVVASECTFFHIIRLRMPPKQPTCKPNCCANVKCPIPKCHPNQMMKPNAGWCGCCPKCVTQLKAGDRCLPKPKQPCPLMPRAECGCGLKCTQGRCCKK